MEPQPLGNFEAFLVLVFFLTPAFFSWRLARRDKALSPWTALGVGFFLSWLGYAAVLGLTRWHLNYRLKPGQKSPRRLPRRRKA
ncbi:MAG: hypothetical protein ACAI34_22020 [Verrucomicrobium sp.]